ncbi:hypothetical protein UFOVP350_47 [uncultured Caudovirales phage]|uniref:Uncharacterized protein n=1 Tax=uncultured Caudovirales phage TaxID=2100421 RepID=A0A6J5LXF3_9CAUD|nr:hypothetical protein UFOVP350_47 [uncultured Caudovirales phage]
MEIIRLGRFTFFGDEAFHAEGCDAGALADGFFAVINELAELIAITGEQVVEEAAAVDGCADVRHVANYALLWLSEADGEEAIIELVALIMRIAIYEIPFRIT